MLGFDVDDMWDNQLKDINDGKMRKPFHYTDTFVLLLGYAKISFHLSCRQTKEDVIKTYERKTTICFWPEYNKKKKDYKMDIKIGDNWK